MTPTTPHQNEPSAVNVIPLWKSLFFIESKDWSYNPLIEPIVYFIVELIKFDYETLLQRDGKLVESSGL